MKYIFLVAFIASGTLLAGGQAFAASAGDLIKCPDFTEVYYLAEDGDRHVFQNENTFRSWYPDFEDVKNISCSDLAEISIGGIVHYREGTRLIKAPSVAKVYFVSPEGLLRSIADEDQAEELFGEDWADQIDDIDESFLVQYDFGEELAQDELPEGLILEDDNGDIFRIDNDGHAEEIDELLNEDEDELFRNSSRDLEELSGARDIEIVLERLEDNLERLEAEIKQLRKAIKVLERDMKDFDDIEDGEEHEIRALDAIHGANKKIDEAIGKINERQSEGKDTLISEELLIIAQETLTQAETAYDSDELFLAEELADSARDYAEDAKEGDNSDEEDRNDDNEDDSDDNELNNDDLEDDEVEIEDERDEDIDSVL